MAGNHVAIRCPAGTCDFWLPTDYPRVPPLCAVRTTALPRKAHAHVHESLARLSSELAGTSMLFTLASLAAEQLAQPEAPVAAAAAAPPSAPPAAAAASSPAAAAAAAPSSATAAARYYCLCFAKKDPEKYEQEQISKEEERK